MHKVYISLQTRTEDQQQYIEVLKNSSASDGNVRAATKKVQIDSYIIIR